MVKLFFLIPTALMIAIFFMPYVIGIIFFPYFLIKRLAHDHKMLQERDKR